MSVATGQASRRRWPLMASAGVLNIAHRGARAFAPENTLPAFAKASDMGCEWVELDVRMTQDGVAVVFHDASLLRLTDAESKFPGRASYEVSAFRFSELLELDAGSWYARAIAGPPTGAAASWRKSLSDAERERYVSQAELERYASGGVRIPSLLEVLSLARSAGVSLNLELKASGRDLDIVEATLELVWEMDMTGRVLVSSFEHRLLTELRSISECVATGVLTDEPLADPRAYLAELDADVYLPACYGRDEAQFAPRLTSIAAAIAADVAVIPWTCNATDDIRRLLSVGVDGIISDYPNRVGRLRCGDP